MRRNSVEVPSNGSKKKQSEKSEKKHQFSDLLSCDPRVKAAPRHVEVIQQLKTPEGGELVYMAKVYGAPSDAPGSELLTVSCVDTGRNHEIEMRFDERYPVSIKFKKQSDPERVEFVKAQVERLGGFDRLKESFRSNFPKFGV